MSTMPLRDIGDGFLLEEADNAEFSRFHAIYRQDPYLRSEAELTMQFCQDAPCRWLWLNGTRVAGLLMGNGAIGQFFLIPPFERRAEALRRVVLALRAADARPLFAHGVTMPELDDYFRIGFRLTASQIPLLRQEEPDYSWQFMRAMVRPAARIFAPPCSASFRPPRKADATKIAHLLRDAYGDTDPMRQEDTSFRQDVTQFFLQGDRAMRAASSLATSQGRVLGVCLIVRWEGAPLLFDIAVHPDARLGGIARTMLAHALTSLYDNGESRLRLFIECGNPAESLYHAMGFIPGPKTTSMVLF